MIEDSIERLRDTTTPVATIGALLDVLNGGVDPADLAVDDDSESSDYEADVDSDSSSDGECEPNDCTCEFCISEKANQDTASILFEISKDIPEGQYIKMCDNLRVIFENGKKVKKTFKWMHVQGAKVAASADIAVKHVNKMGRTIDSCRLALTMSKGKFKNTKVSNVLKNPDRYYLSTDEDEDIRKAGWNPEALINSRVYNHQSPEGLMFNHVLRADAERPIDTTFLDG
jgi:hypothetical protein